MAYHQGTPIIFDKIVAFKAQRGSTSSYLVGTYRCDWAMSTVHAALSACRLLAESPAWSLLRANNAPVAFAVLGSRFSRQRRQVPAAELVETIEADPDELRDRGFDLPQTALNYVRAWLDNGYLVRRPGEAREEFYELSDGALTALRFVEDLAAPRKS